MQPWQKVNRHLQGVYGHSHLILLPGVFIFDTISEEWTEVIPSLPSNSDGPVMCRTGHCYFVTSVGVIFFGGLSMTNDAVSEVLLLDIFGKDCIFSPTSTPTTSRNPSGNLYENEVINGIEGDMEMTTCLPFSRNRSRSWSVGSGGSASSRSNKGGNGSIGPVQSLLNIARQVFPLVGPFTVVDEALQSIDNSEEYILQEEKQSP